MAQRGKATGGFDGAGWLPRKRPTCDNVDMNDTPLDMPELAYDDIKIQFDWHYYDGPLEGACTWQGRRYWFSAADAPANDYGRVLHLLELSPEDWTRVNRSQALYEDRTSNDYEDPDREWLPTGTAVAKVVMWPAEPASRERHSL